MIRLTRQQKNGLQLMSDGDWHLPGRKAGRINSTVAFNLEDMGLIGQDMNMKHWRGYRITEKGRAELQRLQGS